MRRRILCLVLTKLLLIPGTAGCTGADDSADKPVDRLAEARAALPEEIKRSGVLVGGTDPTFEPMTFKRDGRYTGLDVELTEAIAARLGVSVTWRTVSLGHLLDRVAAHEIDFSVSSMFDRAERQKKADFVNYLNAGTSIVVGKGVGDIGGMPGLCGTARRRPTRHGLRRHGHRTGRQVRSGTYDAILTKWKVTEGALRTGAINGGA